jgi:hypothetical protein
MFLGILGGTPEHWGQYCHAYRDAWLKAGHSVEAADPLLQFMDLLETTIGKRRTYLEHEKNSYLPIQTLRFFEGHCVSTEVGYTINKYRE